MHDQQPQGGERCMTEKYRTIIHQAENAQDKL